MSSPSQPMSTINSFQAEFSELFTDLSTSFDRTARLLLQCERKMNDFNASIDDKISSNFEKSEFAEYVAGNPRWRILHRSILNDEVRLRVKIRSILALISDESVDKDTNLDGATRDDMFNNARIACPKRS